MKEKKSTFISKLPDFAFLSCGVIGLANVWAFPFRVGQNDGGFFLLVYLFAIIFVVYPIFIAETIVGKNGKSDTITSIKNLHKENSKFKIGGILGLISSFLVLIFYSVVAGWAVIYFYEGFLYGYTSYSTDMSRLLFNQRTSSVSLGVVVQFLFIFLVTIGVALGTNKVFEKFIRLIMPFIIIFMILLSLYSATLSGAIDSYKFLFTIKLNGDLISYIKVVLIAISQGLFSIYLGMGIKTSNINKICTREKVIVMSSKVILVDTLVSFLSLLILYPIVFTQDVNFKEGISLMFITLNIGLNQISFGRFIGMLIFFVLFISAINAAFSCLGTLVAYYRNLTKLSQKTVTVIIGVIIASVGVFAQPGLNVTIDFLNWLGDSRMLEQIVSLVTIITIPLSALCILVFTAYKVDVNLIKCEFKSEKRANMFINYIRYVLPFLLGSIILLNLIYY